jgi:hypothetical protein
MASTQRVWVHGTSGQIEVVNSDWGEARAWGWGLGLNGKAKVTSLSDNLPDHGEPWVHFHIPMTSRYVGPHMTIRKGTHILPRVREVVVRFATDNEPPINVTGNDEYNLGGAILTSIHLYDGENKFFGEDDLSWQSPDISTFEEKELAVPEMKIAKGLNIVVRFRFKYQISNFDGGLPCTPYVPKDAKPMKAAVIAAVGCVIVPADL